METSSLNIQIQNLEQGLMKYVNGLNLDIEEQDLVQKTFMNAILKKPEKKKDEYLNSWTETMNRKAFINNYRRVLMQKPATNTENLFFIYKDKTDPNLESIFNMLEGKIEHLDKKLIRPFKMYVEGFGYTEIANKLNLKSETVKTRIFMARSQLMIQE